MGGPGLASFIEAEDDRSGDENSSISRTKLQSNRHHQHPVFLQARCPSYHPTNSVRSTEGYSYYAMILAFHANKYILPQCFHIAGLFVCFLGFNGIFSTNRLYRAITEEKNYIT